MHSHLRNIKVRTQLYNLYMTDLRAKISCLLLDLCLWIFSQYRKCPLNTTKRKPQAFTIPIWKDNRKVSRLQLGCILSGAKGTSLLRSKDTRARTTFWCRKISTCDHFICLVFDHSAYRAALPRFMASSYFSP